MNLPRILAILARKETECYANKCDHIFDHGFDQFHSHSCVKLGRTLSNKLF